MRERKGFEMVKIEDLTEEELQAMRIGPDDEAWFAKQAQAAESVPLGIELTEEEAAQIKADTEAVFAQMQAVDLGGLPNADSLDTPWGLEDMPDDWQSLLEAEGLSDERVRGGYSDFEGIWQKTAASHCSARLCKK